MNISTRISRAIADHQGAGIDAYEVLGALSSVAGDLIKQAPKKHRQNLLKAWDESPAAVRADVLGGH